MGTVWIPLIINQQDEAKPTSSEFKGSFFLNIYIGTGPSGLGDWRSKGGNVFKFSLKLWTPSALEIWYWDVISHVII